MGLKTNTVWSVGVCALLAFCISCSPGHHAALELDKIARSVDRYGFASISTPFLTRPAEDFSFSLDKPAEYFFDRAGQSQGAVRHFSAEALDTQLAIRLNVEQALATIAQFNRARDIASIREAKRKAAVQRQMLRVATNTVPELAANPAIVALDGMLGVIAEQPEPDEAALPGFVPTTQPIETEPPFTLAERQALGAVGTLSPGLAMPGGPFQISARQALQIASGDAMTQSLFRWLTYPEGNKLRDYELFFCPMVVSVQPGYETREGFIADVTVNVDLAREKCGGNDRHELEYFSDKWRFSSPPIQVAGVFPVVDSQVLDLANSRRQLYSMAFQLSLLGFGGAADSFNDYAKRLEQDAQTKSALTIASAYTTGGTSFGFRVEPTLVASKDPTRLETEPGRLLESKTFPALAVVLVHRDYLRREGDEESCCPCPDPCKTKANRQGIKQCDNLYDYLTFHTSVRWAPVKEGDRWSRYSEVDAWERAVAMDKVDHWLRSCRCQRKEMFGKTVGDPIPDLLYFGNVPSSRQALQLASRSRALQKLALDSVGIVEVYDTRPADHVCIESITPDHGWLDQYTVLTIRGRGFRGNISRVTVGGIYCPHAVADDRTLLVTVPPWAAKNKATSDELTKIAAVVGAIQTDADNLSSQRSAPPGIADVAPSSAEGVSGEWNDLVKAQLDECEKSRGKVRPLTPSERWFLKALEDKAKKSKSSESNADGESSGEKKDAPDQDSKLTVKERQLLNCLLDLDFRYGQSETRRIATAEIAIASSKPVCFPSANNVDALPKCNCGWSSSPGEPGSENGCTIGCIIFDKQLGSDSGGAPKEGKVTITRNKTTGAIEAVETSGGFANGAQLLQIIKDALGPGGNFEFSLNTAGKVDLRGAGSAPTSQPATNPPAAATP